MQNNNKRIATRLDVAICITLGCLFLVISGFLLALSGLDAYTVVLLCTLGYLLCLLLYATLRLGTESLSGERRLHEAFSGELERVMASLGQPAFLCNEVGSIVWCNRELVDLVGRQDLVLGAEIDDICSLDVAALTANKKDEIVSIGDRLYRYEGIFVNGEDEPLWFVLFTDCTEYEQLSAIYEAETVALAYIVVDNIEELLQYVQDTYRSAANAVEDVIKNWVHGMGGVLKMYEKDKYIAVFDQEHLKACVDKRFEVLDSVRSVRVGDGMPITVSIGVSAVGDSLAEKEDAAQAALDMALQRGGDQAVVRTENGYDYFGGKTKAVQKRNNVRSRVVATELSTLMARTESVLIMGHRFGDFDSFGAAVGVARLAKQCGVRPHIVVNLLDPNLKPCFEKLAEIEDYNDVFVNASGGMDLIRPDTLLIVVDVNNLEHVESPDIVHNVRNLVIIDHHRKTTEFEKEPLLSYIEPSASSASELVSEILEQHMVSKSLLKEEAELLLAGILLDTKQFTRNTGARTFGAALFLRGEGAIPGESSDLFRADVDDLTKEARFHTNAFIYREKIAISYVDGETDGSYRVVAAKAADKLLTVKGVCASFTLVSIGNRIHISARSDGSINVQLILEKVNGGGHYDVAGAQVDGMPMQEMVVYLRELIDHYLES